MALREEASLETTQGTFPIQTVEAIPVGTSRPLLSKIPVVPLGHMCQGPVVVLVGSTQTPTTPTLVEGRMLALVLVTVDREPRRLVIPRSVLLPVMAVFQFPVATRVHPSSSR
jgi:hypothetical protein